MGKSGLFSVSGSNGTRGAIISVSGTRGWAVRAATISVSGRSWRQTFEASRLCMQMAAEAWPVGRIGILESDQGVFAGTGALNRSQLQLHPLCLPPSRVACKTFDGREASRVHRMEVLPTNSERSSITLDIRDLVWLAFLACEVVERRPAKPRGQI